MSFASLLLAYTPLENPGMSDALPYLTGFLVVVFTLTVLLTLCVAVSKILQQVMPEPVVTKPAVKPAPASPATEASPSSDGIPPEVVAVIAAATATVVDKTHRVISIKPQNSSWSQAGRHQHHVSHNIR